MFRWSLHPISISTSPSNFISIIAATESQWRPFDGLNIKVVKTENKCIVRRQSMERTAYRKLLLIHLLMTACPLSVNWDNPTNCFVLHCVDLLRGKFLLCKTVWKYLFQFISYNDHSFLLRKFYTIFNNLFQI